MTNSTQEELERESRSCGVRTDLAPDGIVDVSGVLRLLIADVSGLYVTTTHLLLDEHGDGIFATMDHIAEHARKFGGSTIRAISSLQRPLNEAKPLVSGGYTPSFESPERSSHMLLSGAQAIARG